MSRRRNRKYKKKDNLEEGVIGVFAFLVLVYYIKSDSFFEPKEISTTTMNDFYQMIFLIIAIMIIGFIIVIVTDKYLRKKQREKMVKKQKYINDWFSLSPKDFETFIGAVYEKRGYKLQEVTSYVADHGIDVVLEKNHKKYAVQVKQYNPKNKISEKDVREFYGSYINEFDGGSFVTTSSFTKPARDWAKQRRMHLVDGNYLIKMVDE